MANEPLFGIVPGRKKPGPKPKEKPKEQVVNAPGQCPSCQSATTAIGFDLCRELVKSARDRQAETEAEQRGKAAELDLLYLAARLDGFCSLKCWRHATSR